MNEDLMMKTVSNGNTYEFSTINYFNPTIFMVSNLFSPELGEKVLYLRKAPRRHTLEEQTIYQDMDIMDGPIHSGLELVQLQEWKNSKQKVYN